jgi:ribosomal protein S18 acetylase RimI-like enzyme
MVLELPNYNQLKKHCAMPNNLTAVIYKENTASADTVLKHLIKCSSNFIPNLAETTDIKAYSKKIVENSITFEAWIANNLAGLIAAYFNDEKKITGFITNVSTVKDYAGKGIASQLMHNCIQYGISRHFKTISLEVNSQNKNAIQLYKKYGFQTTGSRQDTLLMKKDL